MQSFESKRVLITGAGGGIGRALAEAFAAEGAKLALTDVNKGWLDETARIPGDAAIKLHACDISGSGAVEAVRSTGPTGMRPSDVAVQILDGVGKDRPGSCPPKKIINATSMRYEEMKRDAAR